MHVGTGVISPDYDGHTGVVLAFESIVVNAVVLAVKGYPKVTRINVWWVVIDDGRIRET